MVDHATARSPRRNPARPAHSPVITGAFAGPGKARSFPAETA